jgi:flagellar hook assembly protein FlgD
MLDVILPEFKWDGTDMYNQRLANGVYLYHVVTNLNGKTLINTNRKVIIQTNISIRGMVNVPYEIINV